MCLHNSVPDLYMWLVASVQSQIGTRAMEISQVNAQCMLCLSDFKFVVSVQRTFREIYDRDPPTDKTEISMGVWRNG